MKQCNGPFRNRSRFVEVLSRPYLMVDRHGSDAKSRSLLCAGSNERLETCGGIVSADFGVKRKLVMDSHISLVRHEWRQTLVAQRTT